MSVLSPPRQAPHEPAPPLPPPRRRGRPGRLVAAALVALALVLGANQLVDLLPSLSNPFKTERVDRSQPAVLQAIEELDRYHAATGHFQVIIDLEEDARYIPSVIKGERTLFVAAGTVDASVDFGGLRGDAVRVSDDRRSVALTLPPARVQGARVDPRRSYVADRDRGLLDRLGSVFSESPTGERELYLLAQKKLEAAAAEAKLAGTAEANTRAMLETLLRSLGFTAVTVTFQAPPAP